MVIDTGKPQICKWLGAQRLDEALLGISCIYCTARHLLEKCPQLRRIHGVRHSAVI